LAGALEYGQTSVVRQNETRIAPHLVEGRSTLLLFTPTKPISNDQEVFVEAMLNGVSMGRLFLKKPADLNGYAEDRITQDTLPRYSTQAWSTQMPTGWMKSGVQLTVGYDELRHEVKQIYAYRVTNSLPPLAAPSELTYTRTKVLFWEDPDSNADTLDSDKLADEIHARMPVSRISIVDYLPARWNSVIMMDSPNPPRRFDSLRQIPISGVRPTHHTAWAANIMVDKANTGRGLQAADPYDMLNQSSPLAYGATLSQGRYKDRDGNLQSAFSVDIARPGWAQIRWNRECGGEMNHALGRVVGLTPFVEGQPLEFGGEYPDGLIWAASHPQPFDTARGVFRTWYAATDGFTIRSSDKPLRGRIDPQFYHKEINDYKEPADSQSCFSPYTNSNTRAIQQLLESTPTLRTVAGNPGYYLWDDTTRTYAPVAPNWKGAALQLKPDRMGIPVATVIGSLTSSESPGASMLFPPLFAASGNTFALEEIGTTSISYRGARYAARVRYADGSHRIFIIPKELPSKDRAYYFSFNLPIADKPVEVSLYRLQHPYVENGPRGLSPSDTLLSTQAITVPTSMPAVVTRGGDSRQEARTAMVSKLCTTQTCETESIDIAWHPDDESQLYFVAGRPSLGLTTPVGNPKDAPMRLEVMMKGPDGNQRVVVFRASRAVNTTADGYRLSPANYWTEPELLKDRLQHLYIWVHANDNTALPAGRYTMTDAVKLLDVHAVSGAGDRIVDRVKLNATFEKL